MPPAIAVQLELANGYRSSDDCLVSIIPQGAEEAEENFYIVADECIMVRVWVFPKEKVHTNASQYEIALFYDCEG